MNKRALSDVVVTVLLILLVLASVVIIWAFLRAFIFGSSSGIETSSLTSNFAIAKDSVVVNSTNGSLAFTLRRDAGNIDAELRGFLVSLKDENGNSKSFRYNRSLNELESARIVENYASLGIGNVSSISIVPIFFVNGKEANGKIIATYNLKSGVSSGNTGTGTVTPPGPGAVCGNNVTEGSEQCDGSDLGGATCASQLGTGYTGTLSCTASCSVNTSSCVLTGGSCIPSNCAPQTCKVASCVAESCSYANSPDNEQGVNCNGLNELCLAGVCLNTSYNVDGCNVDTWYAFFPVSRCIPSGDPNAYAYKSCEGTGYLDIHWVIHTCDPGLKCSEQLLFPDDAPAYTDYTTITCS